MVQVAIIQKTLFSAALLSIAAGFLRWYARRLRRAAISNLKSEDKELAAQPRRLGILACGNPTVDRTIECSAAALDALGLGIGSETAGRDAAFKEKALNTAMRLGRVDAVTPGGAAFNTVRVAAGRFGTAAAFLGCIGADADGEFLRKAAADSGVRWFLPPVSDVATGVCAVLVDAASRDRSLIVVPGAARNLCLLHLECAEVVAALQEASILYATSFVLSTPPRAAVVRQMARTAEKTGATFSLNLSSSGLQKIVAPEILALLPCTKLLFGNKNECEAFADASGLKVDEIAPKLHPEGLLIMTQGADATLVFGRSLGGPLQYSVPSIPKEDIVDTNCAGDSFVAGFLATYEHQGGASMAADPVALSKCVSEGHAAAAQTLRMRGC